MDVFMAIWVAAWGILVPAIGLFFQYKMLKEARNIRDDSLNRARSYPTKGDLNRIEERIKGSMPDIENLEVKISFPEEDLQKFRTMIVSTIDGKFGNYIKQAKADLIENEREIRKEQFMEDPIGTILGQIAGKFMKEEP